MCECEATLAKQGLAIEENQKHGLDQLTMFKKSQSEGLLRQFDKIEQDIEDEKMKIREHMLSTKTELETQCRSCAKDVKSFVRDRNLELNTAQHEGYRELRAVRGGMEETVTNSRREVGGGRRIMLSYRGEGVHRRGEGKSALPAPGGGGFDQVEFPDSTSKA